MSDENIPTPAEPQPEGLPAGPALRPEAGQQALAGPAPADGSTGPEAATTTITTDGRGRRGLALGIAAALVAVVAGGGIGFAVLKHQKADGRHAGSKAWKAPEPKKTAEYGTESGGSHYGALGKLLLPVPPTYLPGPDVDEYGNDAEFTGKQAVAVFEGDLAGLPKKQRDRLHRAVSGLHIQGVGLRTYREMTGQTVLETQIVQMKNKSAARAGTDFFTEFTKALGVFRNGPKIEGHDKARCVLPPKKPGGKLDTMICEATEGDLTIRMSVSGRSPLHKNEAADLFKQQLDRVEDPGEAA
ncbi:hypothetical protein PV703_14930 [Streptomyces sp. ME01-24h]|nr:hypothetical protein [Streptomyces sp. ME19-03-3]MDX3354579.1 hypothetical protein [Streptomyces sp. ME01-24h]